MKKVIGLFLIISILFISPVYAAENLFELIKYQAIPDDIASDRVLSNEFGNGIDYSSHTLGVKWDSKNRQSVYRMNGQGVYYLTNQEWSGGKTVYFFRGDNTLKNVVLFANKCWLIFRTAENNGIKMIYYGDATDNSCSTISGRSTPGVYGKDYLNLSNGNLGLFSGNYMIDSRVTNFEFSWLNNGTKSYSYPYTFTLEDSDRIYGKSFKYEDGKYKLVDYAATDTTDKKERYYFVNERRYTCGGTETECNQLIYIYGMGDSFTSFLTFVLKNGATTDDLLDAAIYNPDNTYDSYAKMQLDKWFENNLLDYQDRIEDVVYCNDRRVATIGPFEPGALLYDRGYTISGTSTIYNTSYYRSYGENWYYNHVDNIHPDLSCRKNDSFTVSDELGNGKLKYPIAMLTDDEVILSVGPIGQYPESGYDYNSVFRGLQGFVMTPAEYERYTTNQAVYYLNAYAGTAQFTNPTNSYADLPVIALKGSTYVDGEGTLENPYRVLDLYQVKYDTSELGVDLSAAAHEEGEEIVLSTKYINKRFGNKILVGWKTSDATIEDNKITMPSNDVVLEPVFEEIVLGATIEKILENPSTGVFNTICYVLGAFIIVSLIGYRIIKKKKMFKKL